METSMRPSKGALTRLGREAAAYLDEATARSTARARARDAFAAATLARDASGVPRIPRLAGAALPSWSGLRGALAGAAFALVAAWAVGLDRRPAPLTFTVGSTPGAAGAWIGARGNVPLPVRFSDGTQMTLDGGANARVFAVDGNGAHVVLERGAAHAAVVHTGTSRWSIGVGPYDVRVTGTRFDVAWDPITQKFSLDLEEGSVLVEGCGLRERRVVAGQSMRATCGESEAPAPETSAAATPASTPVPSAAATPISSPAPAEPRPAVTAEAEPAWNDLALAGRYTEALARVRADYDARCNSLSPSDLLLLADVARYAGDVARAKQAWLALRTRFPEDARASSAAFFLGRTAFEEGAFADAEQWFDVSLRESPSGPLAREAAGRLIEACQRAGDADAARRAARRYLSEYPTGPHAKLAESVVRD